MVPAGGGGTFLGGYMVKKLNMRCRGIIRFCVMCSVMSLATIFIFLLHCPDVPMAGVTAPYRWGLMEQQPLYNHPSKLRGGNRSAASSQAAEEGEISPPHSSPSSPMSAALPWRST